MSQSVRPRVAPTLLICMLCGAAALAAPPTTDQPQGLRDKTPDDVALVGARIVVQPGEVLEKGVVVIRDGVITEVLEGEAPVDTKHYDLSGKTIYAGFIDAFGQTSAEPPSGSAPYWNNLITPQRDVAANFASDASANSSLRSQGFTARLVAPDNGVIKGVSALVATGDASNEQTILQRGVAQHIRLTVPRGRSRDEYPNSPMGAVALARQAMLDAQWHRDARKAKQANPALPSPGWNDALDALQAYPNSDRLVIADAINELYFLRADLFAREFGLNMAMRGSGNEYRRLEAIAATGRTVIVPLNFPKPPNVGSAETAVDVSTEQLMHWDIAPENPARLADADVPILFTTHMLDDTKDFLKNLRKAISRGLPRDEALRALTTRPAKFFGVDDQLGAVSRGKLGNLVVANGDIFADKTTLHSVWVLGKRFGFDKKDPVIDPRGEWDIRYEKDGKAVQHRLVIEGDAGKLKGHWELPEKSEEGKEETKQLKLLRVSSRDARLSMAFEGEKLDADGIILMTAVVDLKDDKQSATGRITWADGSTTNILGDRVKPHESSEEDKDEQKEKDQKGKEGGGDAKEGENKDTDAPEKDKPVKASYAVNYPLGGLGVSQRPEQPKQVLFTNATVWTCGKAGVLKNVSLLIGNGKILAIGKNIRTPDGAQVVDASGMHITPGIIDCHSHMATDGGVNEGTQAITCEVRIGDFIDADDVNIYRQLAGGVTSSNILHGSANPIGGQNQVIKLRWGDLPEQMKFQEAPPGVKFALGENVKQSNWGDEYQTRYPQTRMGVPQIFRDAFQAAIEYRAAWEAWEKDKTKSLPPRRDLELEALAEMVARKRWIHCHSYRQDEILALIRVLDDFKIRIGTFQHILEGYKVAPEMARHGAMGSAFSDWWAYKFEVFDAIPYNGALMHEAGVVVSFNSDDRELARHLNHEAAKAVKYGGVRPEEALKFVTLNPAKQLRIDQYVGSIEKGKHADLVLWSGPPLSTLSRCEQTWVDGRKYFDREYDLAQRKGRRQMRATLIQKILASGEAMLLPGERNRTEETLWPRHDIFCHAHGDHEHDEAMHSTHEDENDAEKRRRGLEELFRTRDLEKLFRRE